MQGNPSGMTRAILTAGVFGGVLGGVLSFAASRWIVPAAKLEPVATPQSTAQPEAREVVDFFVNKLRAGKFEEFATNAKLGTPLATEADAQKFKARLLEFRQVATGSLGPSSGEFELLRETALSPSLVRFVYLEKFERGGVWWTFILYHGKDVWQLGWVDWGANLQGIFGGLS